MTKLNHQEIEELLGAYALDAIEADESAEIGDHLLSCARCRAEVAEHREVAALLANGGTDAPAGLWDRIAASIEGTEPSAADVAMFSKAPLFSRAGAPPRRRSLHSRALVPIVAAAAAVIALLGFQVVGQGNKLDRQGEQIAQMSEEDGLSRAFQSAISDPASQLVALRSADGEHEVQAVVTGSTGFVHAASLPELPDGRTYQLWADLGEQRISLGVLGQRPKVASFALSGDVLGLAITEEEGAGVVVSEQAPLVYAVMPADA
ncbi:MAG: anti-sigma factor [Acidimicrobiales bacterium]